MLAAWRWARAHWPLLVVLAGAAFVLAAPLTRCGPAPATVHEEHREQRTGEVAQLVASHEAVKVQTATVRRKVTTTERRPDGAELVKVEEEERQEAAHEAATDASAATAARETVRTESVRVVERQARLRLSAEVAADVTAPRLDRRSVAAGAAVRVLGPFWMGVRVPVDDPKRPRVVLSAEW